MELTMAHFLCIERFNNGDPLPVYRRMRDQGRLTPTGLEYVTSWITEDLGTCYQVMKGERAKLDQWIAKWQDLITFEVLEVQTSAETQTRVAPRL
jgi:hypothetical protein